MSKERRARADSGLDVTTAGTSQNGRRDHSWVRLRSQRTTFESASSTHGGHADIQGFVLGADWNLLDHWIVGVGGAYATGKLNLEGVAASSDYVAPRTLGYIGYGTKRWAAHVGTSVARTAYDTRRGFRFAALTPIRDDLLFGGVDRGATSAPSGLTTEVWGEQRFNAKVGSWSLHPSVGLRYASYGRHAWTENGGDSLSLSGPAQTFNSKQADAGLWIGRAVGRFGSQASATYRRALGGRQTYANLDLSGQADGAFVVNGLFLARDTLVGRTGLTFRTRSVGLSLAYELQRAQEQMRQTVQFSVGFE